MMELGWPRDAMEPEARDRFGPTVLSDGTDPLNQLLDVGLPLVCFTLGLQSDGQARTVWEGIWVVPQLEMQNRTRFLQDYYSTRTWDRRKCQ